jgi:hypothetical protein
MSYIVILMSFQTIYSINYLGSQHSRLLLDQNFEKFIAPLQYINARKYFDAPPLTSSPPPPRHNKCTFPNYTSRRASVINHQFSVVFVVFVVEKWSFHQRIAGSEITCIYGLHMFLSVNHGIT